MKTVARFIAGKAFESRCTAYSTVGASSSCVSTRLLQTSSAEGPILCCCQGCINATFFENVACSFWHKSVFIGINGFKYAEVKPLLKLSSPLFRSINAMERNFDGNWLLWRETGKKKSKFWGNDQNWLNNEENGNEKAKTVPKRLAWYKSINAEKKVSKMPPEVGPASAAMPKSASGTA